MPSNLLNADTSFPQFTQQTGDKEKIEKLTSYLFMLLEQLRYSLANLDKDNFNDAGLEEIGKIITEPVYVRLEGAEGDIHELNVTAQFLSSRIADAEGNVSTLTQTVNSMRLSVVNGESSSTITLTANGVGISSQSIQFTGMVTFAGLSSGTTVIDGACIRTGTISAVNISGCSIEGSTFRSVLSAYGGIGGEIQFCYLAPNLVAGGIRLDDQGTGSETESRYRMFLYTRSVYGVSFAMKLQSAGGISIEAARHIYCSSGMNFLVSAGSIRMAAADIHLSGNVYINGALYAPESGT